MKYRLLSTVAALLSISAFAACAATGSSGVYTGVGPDGGTLEDGGTSAEGGAEDSDDPADQPPHSLGTIVLGETHGSGTTTKSVPIVSAAFLPDAMLSRACKKKLEGGCEITEIAKCTKASTTSGCSTGEACVLDNTTCKATCKAVAVCTQECDTDEVCKPPAAGTTGTAGTCVKSQSFDAGPLAFSGTTTSITMFPPYGFQGTGQGAPFLAGAELQVQASGATEAGFEKFDEKFTATTFLQMTPSLSKITKSAVFGTGALPIAWAAAEDTIVISITGAGGTATCKVKDSLGKFDVPRAVVKAAQGDGTTTSSTSLSIAVSRQKREVKKDKTAKGTLALTEVKPDGWLELITQSTETASFQGCSSTQTICDDLCTDLTRDRLNCGACGKSCGTGTCSLSTCSNGL